MALATPGRRRDHLDLRRGVVVLRGTRPPWSARVHARAAAVTVVLAAVTFLVFAWSLSVGDFPIPFTDVLASLLGAGSDDARFIVTTLRLPRGLTGLLVGAGFGVAGVIFQRLARNPLASPDIIGVTAGAAAAAVFAIVVVGVEGAAVTLAAFAGAIGTAVAVYLLAYRRGVTGYRFVLVGIGATAVLHAVVQYLQTRARIFEAQRSLQWLAGSLNGRGWEHVRPVALVSAVLIPVALLLARQLRVLELGDDAARGLGARVEWSRAALLLVAVALVAIGTASAGPIGFVALVAPQIARRLTGGRSVGLVAAGVCGALLVVAADLLGRRLFAPTELPVGIVTAVLGAPFLLYLLSRANSTGADA